MINIDPKRGTWFNGKKITISEHAKDEAVKDFRIKRDFAGQFITENLRKAQFIDDIVNDDGKPARLFGYDRIAFIVDVISDHVITVYKRIKTHASIRHKVEELVRKELRKANRKVAKLERDTNYAKDDLAVERALCQRAANRTKSKAKKLANEARVHAIDEYTGQLDSELKQAKLEKATLAKGVVVYL